MAAPCRDLITGLRLARPQPGSSRSASELCLAPFHRRQQGRRPRRGGKVVAAISEDMPKLAPPPENSGAASPEGGPKQTEKVAVRAALTVRRKQKEDLKEAVAGHLDALWDMVGRSVKLELISTKIHPSKLSLKLDTFQQLDFDRYLEL
jgi:lipoxygenase